MLKPPQLSHSYKAGAQFPPQLQLLTYELLTYSNLSKREETLIQIRPVCTPWVFPYHLLDDNLEVQKTCISHFDNIFSGLAPCPRIPDCPFFLELFSLSLLTSPKSNFNFMSLFLPNLLTIHCPCNIILSQSPRLKDQTSQESPFFSSAFFSEELPITRRHKCKFPFTPATSGWIMPHNCRGCLTWYFYLAKISLPFLM